jgi:hypothetical protein
MTTNERIEAVQKSLTWSLQVDEAEVPCAEISSSERLRSHTIRIPNRPFGKLDFLHELGHAWLCENVHPLFSTCHFVPGTSRHARDIALEPIRHAADWFVEGWLRQFGRVAADRRAEVKQWGEEFWRLVQEHEDRYAAMIHTAYCRAILIHYRDMQVESSGSLKPLTDVFLACPPSPPQFENFQALINALLAVPHPGYSVLRVREGDISAWLITSPGG